MGSPPRKMKPLLLTSISPNSSSLVTHFTFNRIDKTVRDESVGPHSNTSKQTRSSNILKHRPLSPIKVKTRNATIFTEEEFTKMKEDKARKSPYLKHLNRREREEILMELGSVVHSADSELKAELELKTMLQGVIIKHQNMQCKNRKVKNKMMSKIPKSINRKLKLTPLLINEEKWNDDEMDIIFLEQNQIIPHTQSSSMTSEIWGSDNDTWRCKDFEEGDSDTNVQFASKIAEFEYDDSYHGDFVQLSSRRSNIDDEFS